MEGWRGKVIQAQHMHTQIRITEFYFEIWAVISEN